VLIEDTVIICTRHDRNPSKSKSLSHLKIFYSCLTPILSHSLIVNTVTNLLKWEGQYWNGDTLFQIHWLSWGLIMPDLYPTISVPWIKSSMPPLGVFIFYLFVFIYLFTYLFIYLFSKKTVCRSRLLYFRYYLCE